MQKLVTVLAKPVNIITDRLHLKRPKFKSVTRFGICCSGILGGAYMATHVPGFVSHDLHFVWDAIAYGIHGLFGAPLIERVMVCLSLAE